MKLLDYFLSNQNRRMIHKPVHHFEIYERYFSRFIGTDVKVLEIGISHGGSLQMWKKYFGEGSQIIGIDINGRCSEMEVEGFRTYIGDQSDIGFLNKVIEEEKYFDIIIDDGGHSMKQQIVSFEILFSSLADGGIYMCEDTGTSYINSYHDYSETFIEMAKQLVDKIPDISNKLKAIHFHDNVVVFESGIKEVHNTQAIGI